jgi:Kef-type K+ transport system membrane component KefB
VIGHARVVERHRDRGAHRHGAGAARALAAPADHPGLPHRRRARRPQLGFGLIHDAESIEIISEIGLILLLFIIGLELDVKALLASGRQLLVAGFGQFLLCVAMGVGVFAALGYGLSGAKSDGLYFALMCGLSSTAVVVKLLYDKGELDTLPGRMTLGILVIQDIYAIFVLAFQPNFANPSFLPVAKALGWTVVLLIAGFAFAKYVLRWVFASIDKAPEMVVAVSIGWCAGGGGVGGGDGAEQGDGRAGGRAVHRRVPLQHPRDGQDAAAPRLLPHAVLHVAGAEDHRPELGHGRRRRAARRVHRRLAVLTIYPLLALTGAGRRTAFVTTLNLSQISEFSLVIASLGVVYKHIPESTVAVIIYAMAITAVLSSYAIRYNHALSVAWDKLLGKLGRGSSGEGAKPQGGGHEDEDDRGAVVMLGVHRSAWSLVSVLESRDPETLRKLRAIDFNTETLDQLGKKGIFGTFGDLGSLDTLGHAHLERAKLILCSIPTCC